MENITRTELRWTITAIEHYMAELARENNAITDLRCKQMEAIALRLEDVLANGDKRIGVIE